MEIKGETTLYRKDYDGRPVYSRMVSSKKFENGKTIDEWQNAFQRVQMPRGTDLPNKTKINIISGKEVVYMDKNDRGQIKTLVFEFAEVKKAEDQTPTVEEENVSQDIPSFQEIAEDCPF